MGGFAHCQLLGVDQQALRDRLYLLELGEKDKPVCEKLHRLTLQPFKKTIVIEFYDFIISHKEYRAFIKNDVVRKQLELTFEQYLDSLGKGYDRLSYCERRLAVGVAHSRIGLSLSLYECAYRKLRQLIVDSIPCEIHEETRSSLIHFVDKIVALDMSLAIDSYFQSSVSDLHHTVSKLKSHGEKLRLTASMDPLTAVLNRGGVMDVLHARIDAAVNQPHENTYLIMADVDNLGKINDEFGHLVGDHVLKRIVMRMKHVVDEEKAIIGRYGGDEFIVMLCDIEYEQAMTIAKELQQVVSGKSFKLGERVFDVTLSQGVARVANGEKVGGCLQRIDRLLYLAKTGDGGQIFFEQQDKTVD